MIFLEKKKSSKETEKTYRTNREDSNFLLGCFNVIKEDYDEIRDSLRELSQFLENLKEIKYQDKTYTLEYFLGGDLKFLSLVLGINAANSIYPCPWCESAKGKFLTNIHQHISYREFDSEFSLDFICQP